MARQVAQMQALLNQLIGYSMASENLLLEALDTTGLRVSESNQRLALLGDAVLKHILLDDWYPGGSPKGSSPNHHLTHRNCGHTKASCRRRKSSCVDCRQQCQSGRHCTQHGLRGLHHYPSWSPRSGKPRHAVNYGRGPPWSHLPRLREGYGCRQVTHERHELDG